jgi:hypothetical protein
VLLESFAHGEEVLAPFRHWRLCNIFPAGLCEALVALPLPMALIGDTLGKRESHNESRVFFSPARRGQFPLCDALARAFLSREVVTEIEGRFGAALHETYLRIEYCQDGEGFWLAPHTDLKVKRLTMQVFLSRDTTEAWGTDLFNEDLSFAGRIPAQWNHGYAFVPGTNTWHGFQPRSLHGIRRSLIVNYVTEDWRARHELADPAFVGEDYVSPVAETPRAGRAGRPRVPVDGTV